MSARCGCGALYGPANTCQGCWALEEECKCPRQRPILFSGRMVRALLAGRKAQTRRVMNPQPIECTGLESGQLMWREDNPGERGALERRSPYGVPGDRLWVRETWMPVAEGAYRYRADYQSVHGGKPGLAWKPSIFMPRAASRILLEVTGVRVERVQEITEEDAIAEGSCIRHTLAGGPEALPGHNSARECFAAAWDGINLKRGFGWQRNPWVWVVDFKRLEPEAMR